MFVPVTTKLVMSKLNETQVAPFAAVSTDGTIATNAPFMVIVSSFAPSKSNPWKESVYVVTLVVRGGGDDDPKISVIGAAAASFEAKVGRAQLLSIR